jgi:hypothetical protein
MAKMSEYELRKMRGSIIDSAYRKREGELEIRKTAIAKKNRELQLEPIQHLLKQLPIDIISHADEYIVRVKYTPEKDNTAVKLDEKWAYKTDDPVINPQKVSNSHYQNTPDNELKEELWPTTGELCEDILELRTEKEELTTYLNETTKKYTGSLQLREKWKNEPGLLKHLPAEPVKVSRPKPVKKVSDPDLKVPTFLKTRMTTNLLEDN